VVKVDLGIQGHNLDIATRLYNFLEVNDESPAEAFKEFESHVLHSSEIGSLYVVVFKDLTAIVFDPEEHTLSCFSGVIFKFMTEEMLRDMVENHAH
jgi:hypothetical protein